MSEAVEEQQQQSPSEVAKKLGNEVMYLMILSYNAYMLLMTVLITIGICYEEI